MRQPKTIDFYRCTRPMQDRFVAATSRSSPPAPLLFKTASRRGAWVWLGASALLVVAATWLLVLGWGDVASGLAIHRPAMLAVDVAIFAAAAYAFVHASALLRALEALPYRAGTYLFPACVVDASGPVLRVWPVSDAEAIEKLPTPGLAFRMRDGGRVVVPAARPEDAERADEALSRLRPELTRALAEEDVNMLAELDPLHHTSVSSPISSTQALTRFAPLWMRFDWAVALLAGVALGLGLGSMRNASSDERMYHNVSAAQDVKLYEQYLSHGGRHAEEVSTVLLPRAELRQVQAQRSVAALQSFAEAHPSSPIQPEIDAAMHAALLRELEHVKRAGTVAALDAFAQKYPNSHLYSELQAARHALYAKALSAWQASVRADAATTAFMQRLLASAEKGKSSVQIRFRLRPSKTMDEIDRRIGKHIDFPGSDALPSRYVNAAALHAHEARVAQAVSDAFAAAFPADLLTVRPGDPLPADAPAPAGAPVLVVDYAPEWSGANAASTKPRSVFAGFRFDFDARFSLPEGAAPLEVLVKSARGPELWKMRNTNVLLTDYEQKVYDDIMDHSFDDLQKRLLETFFRKP